MGNDHVAYECYVNTYKYMSDKAEVEALGAIRGKQQHAAVNFPRPKRCPGRHLDTSSTGRVSSAGIPRCRSGRWLMPSSPPGLPLAARVAVAGGEHDLALGPAAGPERGDALALVEGAPHVPPAHARRSHFEVPKGLGTAEGHRVGLARSALAVDARRGAEVGSHVATNELADHQQGAPAARG